MRKFRSITSSIDANLYVGPFGEIVVDDSGQLRIQDNLTAGGHLVVADTGNIRFVDSIISTVDSSSNIVIDSDRLTVTNAIGIGNLSIHNNNIVASTNVITFTSGAHSFTFRDSSAGFNQGTGAIFKFDNIENSNGPTFETWYGEDANPYDPPGQHSLDIRVASNTSYDYVEFASNDWKNYLGLNNQTVYIQTDWLANPEQAWVFDQNGKLLLPAQGIITSHTEKSQVVITDSNVSIESTNSNTLEKFGLRLEDGYFVFGGHVIPVNDTEQDLGSPENQWRHLYVSSNTIYIGGTPLTVTNGDLTVNGNAIVGGGGLPTVTLPAVPPTTYKGLQVAYGVIHSNSNSNEYNVNKLVIHKPTTATVSIDPNGTNDDFRVSGISASDVLAMFVVYGDTNGPKPLLDLQAFAEAVIDNVILDGGVEGSFNTVDEMKTAFANNYQTIASAANGLYTNFEFFASSVNTIDNSTTTREGSGAIFEITNAGDGTYQASGILNNGTNYLLGHRIKVLGTDLGGATPDNDCIITVDSISEGGLIFQWSVSGTAAGNSITLYSPVTGTNIDVGSGFTVASISINNGVLSPSLNSSGDNYVVGDVITLTGDKLQNGITPDNDITFTVVNVGGVRGPAYNVTTTGTLPEIWPENSISDGGVDQYDTGNYINTNLANEINYNAGNTVVDGTAAFGAGSSYSFAYETAIFGLFVTGSSAEFLSTSGGSGADGGSTTEAGNIYDPGSPQQTLTNAVTHLNIYGTPYLNTVTFTKTDNGSEVDILIPDDGNGAGVGITRDSNNGIFNPYREGSWDSDVSPGGTLWNIDGWSDLTDVESRLYAPLYETFGFGGLGNKIVGAECVMYLPDNGKYYTVEFSSWTQGGNGGGFAYTRKELNLSGLEEGIKFADGTRLTSAEGVGRVKSTASSGRRIEEVAGNSTVTVTARTTQASVSATVWDTRTDYYIYINWDQSLYNLYNGATVYTLEFSQDNATWYPAEIVGASSNTYLQLYMTGNRTISVTQGETVYYRVSTGGDPVVWWRAADLPSGSSNFRGAVIDYHAFTGDGTIIGTIHIVDDDGEENITHTEVSSGSTDSENNDLWIVQNEGTISYRRIDGIVKTMKIHWIAKVFYGSEIYD